MRMQPDTPVIKENIISGRVGSRVHGLAYLRKETRCGLSIYTNDPSVQFSVEPDGTPITCPACKDARSTAFQAELLAAWYRAERSVIHEHSGDISADMRHLHQRATMLAAEHGLPFTEELEPHHLEEES